MPKLKDPSRAQRDALLKTVEKLSKDYEMSVAEACAAVGLTQETYKAWKEGKDTKLTPRRPHGHPVGATAPTLESLAREVKELRERLDKVAPDD